MREAKANEYAVGDDERYVLASIVLQFSAYSGGGNQARVRASRAETEALAARRQQTKLAVIGSRCNARSRTSRLRRHR